MIKYLFLGACSLILFAVSGYSQTYSQDKAIPLQATVISSSKIMLQWQPHPSANYYKLYRREKDSGSPWILPYTSNLPGTDSTYTDTGVVPNKIYEYKLYRGNPGAESYIFSSYEADEIHHFGTLILIVDSTFKQSLATEIAQLEEDITGDGWTVITKYVDKTDSVPDVKALITSEYNSDPNEVKAVMLLGHVPVPYSGNLAPDGHPNHVGAWAADCYYGDMDGNWTDNSVNVTGTVSPKNDNIPGDGKFDQSNLPSDIELYVGRVDFYDMGTFPETEEQLLRRYLVKNHDYRNAMYVINNRGLVEDNFSSYAEGFAQNGYRNFGPLAGYKNIITGDYRTDLKNGFHYWSYGCGGGTNTSASGIISTSQFASDSILSVFTMVFGSYFGDFDKKDNLLRASLGSGLVLANMWAGRPNVHLHAMGIGEPIGYTWRLSINNGNTYVANNNNRKVHLALIGDPGLRAYPVKPVSNVVVNNVQGKAQISWTASQDSNIVGYNVYVKSDSMKHYTVVNSSRITGTSFNDPNFMFDPGTYRYMVRAVKREESPSGIYFNMSTGRTGNVVSTGVEEISDHFAMDIYPNPASRYINVRIAEENFLIGSIKLINLEGKVIESWNNIHSGNTTLNIPKACAAGTYLLQVQCGDKKTTQKLIIK